MAWRFTIAGEVFREGDLTLGQAEDVENLVLDKDGNPTLWGSLNPLRSARHSVAVAAVMLAARRDITVDEAQKIVRAEPMLKFVEEYGTVEDDLPSEYTDGFPPQADAPSISG